MASTSQIGSIVGGLVSPQQVGSAAAARSYEKAKLGPELDSVATNVVRPIAALGSGVSDGLQATIRDAGSKVQSLLVDSRFGDQLQALFDPAGGASGIDGSITALGQAFANVAANPGGSCAIALDAAASLAAQLKSTGTGIQTLRGRADQDLVAAVGAANAALQRIATVNDRMSVAVAQGAPTNGLAGQRDAALDALSNCLDFASFGRPDGTVAVYTKSGTPLVNGAAAVLACTAAPAVDPAMNRAAGSLAGVTADGKDVSGEISTGTIGALLQARDTSLPNVQEQLDTLAQTLQARINQLSNRAIVGAGAAPAYTGTRGFSDPGAQRITLTGGDTLLTLVDGDGRSLAQTSLTSLMTRYRQANGLPADGAWPIGQIASALDGWLAGQCGTAGASAALDAGGRLSVSLGGGTAAALVVRDQAGSAIGDAFASAPAAGQAADDVAVGFQAGQQSNSFSSSAIANPAAPLGLGGTLAVSGEDGAAIATVAIDPSCDLNGLAAKINGAAGGTASASVVSHGTGYTLKIVGADGNKLSLDGLPYAYQTSSAANFSAAGGSLAIGLSGATVGRLAIKAGDDLQTIAEGINDAAGPFAACGIRAAVRSDGSASTLEVGAVDGQGVQLTGSAVGNGAGQLDLRLNPRDALALSPPASQVVSGLANFFGLNDVFAADPADAFDSKAAAGIFTSTASPGTAQSLKADASIADNPRAFADPGSAQQIADTLASPVNIAAAGGMPRGSYSFAQYAGRIAAAVAANATDARSQLGYQRVLVEGLKGQQAGLPSMTMDDRLTDLATYQQTYHNSTRVVSTIPQLLRSLGDAA
jgi:flagellar hook-associated protein 1